MATTPVKTYVDGSWGTVSFGGNALCVNKWDFTGEAKNNETPTSCTPGFNSFSPGQRTGSGNLTVFFDGTVLPTFVEGQTMNSLRLGNQGATPGTVVVMVSAASVIIDSVKITSPNPGAVTYDITFHVNYSYQYGDLPTGS